MIPLNELRQGVWVFEHNQYLKVDLRQSDFWHYGLFDPIPLTPEILEKAGFGLLKKATTQKWVKYGIHPFELKIGAKRDSYPFYLQGYKFYPYPLYSVHQLQNLYFALTGQELEVKL